MPAPVKEPIMRAVLRAGWTRWCAAILLALVALSTLHAVTPHSATQRDCSTCKALDSPGVAQASRGFGPAHGGRGRGAAARDRRPQKADPDAARPVACRVPSR